MQVWGCPRRHSHLHLAGLWFAPGPSLHGTKVQLWVRVHHALVGGLEVVQDGATCQAKLLVGLGIEKTAADEGRGVAYAGLGGV